MAFNGSGTFVLVSGNPVVTGTTISSTWANNTLSDVATGLSNCVTRDGQSPATANLPMGGFKLTGLATATALGDALSYGRAATVSALTDSALTSGRVTYASTAGLLADSANLTFDGTTLTAAGLATGGSVTLSGGTANGVAYLNGSKVLTTGSGLVFDGNNLGLGVTPSAWSGYFALDINTRGLGLGGGNDSAAITTNAYYNVGWKYKGTSAYAVTSYQQYNGAHSWYNAPSGTAGNAISFTQAMTLDASGNLLVGITGVTGSKMQVAADSGNIVYFRNTAGTGIYLVSGNNTWSTVSDERYKTQLTPFENAVDKLCMLRAGTGRYLIDDENVSRSFLIAQDVEKVLPEAVSIADKKTGYLGLAYTDMIPLLVAAIQELKAELDELKQKVN